MYIKTSFSLKIHIRIKAFYNVLCHPITQSIFIDITHYMAGRTKGKAVGLFDDSMNPTPENNPKQGAANKHNQSCFTYLLTHGLHRL